MTIIHSDKKQKRIIARYHAHLRAGQQSENASSNMNNLLDDDSAVDERLIKKTRRYMVIHYKHTA